jgi:hypothetical protein
VSNDHVANGQQQLQEVQIDQAAAAAAASSSPAALNAAVLSFPTPAEGVGMKRKSANDHSIREGYYQARWRFCVPEPAGEDSSADERTTGRKLRGTLVLADPTKRRLYKLYEGEPFECQPCRIEDRPRKLVWKK